MYKAKPYVIFACGPETRRDFRKSKVDLFIFFCKVYSEKWYFFNKNQFLTSLISFFYDGRKSKIMAVQLKIS